MGGSDKGFKMHLAAALCIGFIFGIASVRMFAARKQAAGVETVGGGGRIEATEKGVWVLGVGVKFKDLEAKNEFKTIFAPLAKYVAENEPETLTYMLSESDQSPLDILILERYKSKEKSYLQIHKNGEIFKDFRARMQQMIDDKRLTVSGNSYIESGLGYA